MKLHVLTAVTRPQNLQAVAASLARAADVCENLELVWHWQYDPRREYVGGQALKNQMLDGITDGWVWILDDDTICDSQILARFGAALIDHPEAEAIVFSQERPDLGRRLRAAAENARMGEIDAGQAFLARNLIGDERLPVSYEGDGYWLEALLSRAAVIYVDEPLSLYNALGG